MSTQITANAAIISLECVAQRLSDARKEIADLKEKLKKSARTVDGVKPSDAELETLRKVNSEWEAKYQQAITLSDSALSARIEDLERELTNSHTKNIILTARMEELDRELDVVCQEQQDNIKLYRENESKYQNDIQKMTEQLAMYQKKNKNDESLIAKLINNHKSLEKQIQIEREDHSRNLAQEILKIETYYRGELRKYQGFNLPLDVSAFPPPSLSPEDQIQKDAHLARMLQDEDASDSKDIPLTGIISLIPDMTVEDIKTNPHTARMNFEKLSNEQIKKIIAPMNNNEMNYLYNEIVNGKAFVKAQLFDLIHASN